MHRLFVAIRPPEPIRDLLIDAMDDSADFRWQDDEQLHLTLRFVGEVERPLAEDLALRWAASAPSPSNCALTVSAVSSSAIPALCGPGSSRRARSQRSPRRSSAFSRSASNPSAAPFIRTSRSRAGRAAGHARSHTSSTHPRPRVRPVRGDRFILFESRLSRHGAHYEEVATYPL